eukprot:3336093-Amphidinium_carterae.1
MKLGLSQNGANIVQLALLIRYDHGSPNHSWNIAIQAQMVAAGIWLLRNAYYPNGATNADTD